MKSMTTVRAGAVLSITALLIGGCAQTRQSSTQPQASGSAPPAASTASPGQPKVGPGMNDKGEVVDSSKIQAGSGQKVKGLNNWEGEITGKPAPGSPFTKIEIGMSMRQVVDLVGQPTDQGAYITGKSFIPFYFGADRHRFEMVYKNQGRLIFAGGSLGNFTGGNLVWIIHNGSETGYR